MTEQSTSCYGRSAGQRAFLVIFALLLVRSLFSGWDLANDFQFPSALKWSIDLGLPMLLLILGLSFCNGNALLRVSMVIALGTALSFLISAFDPYITYGQQKTLSLSIVNSIIASSVFALYGAAIYGRLIISPTLLDRLAKFFAYYSLVCIFVGGVLAYRYAKGSDIVIVGGRFFLLNPATLRLSGLFSEPSYMGFFVGFSALFLYARRPAPSSVFSSVPIVFGLFILIRAKFASIAFITAILAPAIVRRLSVSALRYCVYSTLFLYFFLISAGADDYIFRYVISLVDYEEQKTFVTRFAHSFSALHHLSHYPLGAGFGGWLSTLPEFAKETAQLAKGLDNSEIVAEVATSVNFAPKDSISFLLLSLGWLGAVAFVEFFVKSLDATRGMSPVYTSLVIYFWLSCFVFINVFAVPICLVIFIILLGSIRKNCQRFQEGPA